MARSKRVEVILYLLFLKHVSQSDRGREGERPEVTEKPIKDGCDKSAGSCPREPAFKFSETKCDIHRMAT